MSFVSRPVNSSVVLKTLQDHISASINAGEYTTVRSRPVSLSGSLTLICSSDHDVGKVSLLQQSSGRDPIFKGHKV